MGRVDILINNAGIVARRRPEDLSLAEWQSVIATNLTSAFLCAQLVYPAMKAAGGGKIINIGSMLSLFGAPFGAAYGASKGGLVQLTRSLAVAWAADSIQVNAILPGWIDTAMGESARSEVSDLETRVTARTPAGRWGQPDDMAGVARFPRQCSVRFHHRRGNSGGWRLLDRRLIKTHHLPLENDGSMPRKPGGCPSEVSRFRLVAETRERPQR
jgi:NAD(P)-dependent dehydrogenase (short-subunit alcohol dehydrogenase family)